MPVSNTIAVVGGGITGLISAIRLQQSGYLVKLFERNEGVFSETSAIVSEAHSGAEYPFDPKSGTDCLDGLIEFVRYLPDEIFNNKGRTVFFVAEKSKEHVVQMRKHIIEILKSHYADLIAKNPENKIFGEPDQAFTEHNPTEFSQIPNVAAAFVTPQRGFNVVYLATILKKYAEEIGVVFKLSHEVQEIVPPSNNNRNFVIKAQSVEAVVEEDFFQVVIAAYYRGFDLAKKINPEYDSQLARSNFREISVAQLKITPDALVHTTISSTSTIQGPATCFTMNGSHGGMFSPISPGNAIFYHPDPKSGHITSRTDDIIPGVWSNGTRLVNRTSARAENALNNLQAGIYSHLLKEADVASTHFKITISNATDNEQRQNPGPKQVIPGCIDLSLAPKATTSVINSNEAVKMCLKYSYAQKHLSKAEYKSRLNVLNISKIPYPATYKKDFNAFLSDAEKQAERMLLPKDCIQPFEKSHIAPKRKAEDRMLSSTSKKTANNAPLPIKVESNYFLRRKASVSPPPQTRHQISKTF